jgi:hypothetical protein
LVLGSNPSGPTNNSGDLNAAVGITQKFEESCRMLR